MSRPQHEAPGLREITVRATNFDGSLHWEHPAWLKRTDSGLVMTQTAAGLVVKATAHDGGEFVSPYNTNGHYWPDRWFNVIRLELPGQGLYGYYCNIATPLQFDGATVNYVDLQLDVLVRVEADGSLTQTLEDEDEFLEAKARYGYAEELVSRCYGAAEEVVRMVEAREFPFDG
jgi:protein associated with RNAse G/E